MRFLRRQAVVVAALVGLGAAAPLDAGNGRRPSVDMEAMREAMGVGATDTVTYPSAASYAHFLKARLSHHDGQHRSALDELRLALATDDGNPYLMTELAEQYARVSDLDRAEAQLRRVLERAPEYAPAQLLMGRVLFEAQKMTRARVHLGRAIKLQPQQPDAYLVLSQLWLDQGRVDEATKVVDRLGVALPGEPIGYRRLGLALAERGDRPRAEALLRKAVDRDPGDFEVWVSLATLYEQADEKDRALDAYSHALERDPESKPVLLAAGRMALRQGKEAEAQAYFDALLSLSRDPEVAVKISFSYLAIGKTKDAAEVLDRARAGSGEGRLHFYAGLVHQRRRSFKAAAEAFGDVPATAGDLWLEAEQHRAACLSSLGQHRQALELFRSLSVTRGDQPGLDVAWARAAERAGQLKESEALLLRALATRPHPETLDAVVGFYDRQKRHAEGIELLARVGKRPEATEAVQFALAAAYGRQGDWHQAVAQMERVLKSSPDNAAALNFIGYTLAENGGNLDEAEAMVRRALKANPDSPAFLDSLGWVHFKRGDAGKAVEVLTRAVELSPEEPTLLEHLSEAQAKAGKPLDAVVSIKKALVILSEDPDTAERVGQRVELERKLKLLGSAGRGR